MRVAVRAGWQAVQHIMEWDVNGWSMGGSLPHIRPRHSQRRRLCTRGRIWSAGLEMVAATPRRSTSGQVTKRCHRLHTSEHTVRLQEGRWEGGALVGRLTAQPSTGMQASLHAWKPRAGGYASRSPGAEAVDSNRAGGSRAGGRWIGGGRRQASQQRSECLQSAWISAAPGGRQSAPQRALGASQPHRSRCDSLPSTSSSESSSRHWMVLLELLPAGPGPRAARPLRKARMLCCFGCMALSRPLSCRRGGTAKVK